jgi:hypothetical protein
VDFTIAAGNTESFSKNCNDIQAVMVHVDVMVAGSIGPSKTSDVFRDGDDFGCGDTVSFTFTTPAFPSDVNIDFSQRP